MCYQFYESCFILVSISKTATPNRKQDTHVGNISINSECATSVVASCGLAWVLDLNIIIRHFHRTFKKLLQCGICLITSVPCIVGDLVLGWVRETKDSQFWEGR